MDTDEHLRLDYDQTTGLLRTLIDVRFKLLAFVPSIAGTTVAIFGRPRPAVELLSVGLLGLVATTGVLLYELRNTQLADAVLLRAQELERRLGLPSVQGGEEPGGLFRERPRHDLRLFGLVQVTQGRGVALVYGAALAGWSYLVVWGVLRALEVGSARKVGAVLGGLLGLLVFAELERIHRRSHGTAER